MTGLQFYQLLTPHDLENENSKEVEITDFERIVSLISQLDNDNEKHILRKLISKDINFYKANLIIPKFIFAVCNPGKGDKLQFQECIKKMLKHNRSQLALFLCDLLDSKNDFFYKPIKYQIFQEMGDFAKAIEVLQELDRFNKASSDELEILMNHYKNIDDGKFYYYCRKSFQKALSEKKTNKAINLLCIIVKKYENSLSFLEKIVGQIFKEYNFKQSLYIVSCVLEQVSLSVETAYVMLRKLAFCCEVNIKPEPIITVGKKKNKKNSIKKTPTDNDSFFNIFIPYAKKKYKDSPYLNGSLKSFKGQESLSAQIKYFEKINSFDRKVFVWHDTWGLGIINSIKDHEVLIAFKKKGDHVMKDTMAFSSLQILPKNHITVLKSCANKEELVAKVKTDYEWTFKTIIDSYDGSATLADIRKELDGVLIKDYFSWIQLAIEKINNNRNFVQVVKNGRIAFAYSEGTKNDFIEEKETAISRANIIPPNHKIYIKSQNFDCLSKGHKIHSFYTDIPVKTERGIKTVQVYIDYCKNCGKFFISDLEFNSKLKFCSDILLRCFVSPSGRIYGPKPQQDIGVFSQESALKKAGYSVSKQDDLPSNIRQQVLDEVILYGIMDVPTIKSYLQFFISYLGKNQNMEDAVDNWMMDLNYVNRKYSKFISFFDL